VNPLKGASDNTLGWILGFGTLLIAIVCFVLEFALLSVFGIGLRHAINGLPEWLLAPLYFGLMGAPILMMFVLFVRERLRLRRERREIIFPGGDALTELPLVAENQRAGERVSIPADGRRH
jgi:hypothetical protein